MGVGALVPGGGVAVGPVGPNVGIDPPSSFGSPGAVSPGRVVVGDRGDGFSPPSGDPFESPEVTAPDGVPGPEARGKVGTPGPVGVAPVIACTSDPGTASPSPVAEGPSNCSGSPSAAPIALDV